VKRKSDPKKKHGKKSCSDSFANEKNIKKLEGTSLKRNTPHWGMRKEKTGFQQANLAGGVKKKGKQKGEKLLKRCGG